MHRMFVFAAIASLAACAGEPSQTESILELEADLVAGAEVYAGTCALCHGASGEGTNLGVQLAGTSLSKEEVVMQILTGNTEGMAPAADYGLADQDVADVAGHVLGL